MEHAICLLSIVPVRAEPNDRAEMVNQLLFGDLMEVEDERYGWLHVKINYDGYSGWIDIKQCTLLDEESFNVIRQMELHLVADPVGELIDDAGRRRLVVAGSALPGLQDNKISLAGKTFRYRGASVKWGNDTTGEDILEIASMFEGVPYLWGGKTPFGIDCSGFTQIVYRLASITMERDAHRQALQGIPLSFISEAQSGDLAFFDDKEGGIIHVGIVTGDGKIIHASGQVRVDLLDHQGIFSLEKQSYTHSLRLIRHLL